MSKSSATDWGRVKREAEAEAPIPFDPEVDPYDPNDSAAAEAFWAEATVRRPGQRGPQKAPTKVFTGIRLDADVLEAFRAQGKGWQTRVNAALREWLSEHLTASRPPT